MRLIRLGLLVAALVAVVRGEGGGHGSREARGRRGAAVVHMLARARRGVGGGGFSSRMGFDVVVASDADLDAASECVVSAHADRRHLSPDEAWVPGALSDRGQDRGHDGSRVMVGERWRWGEEERDVPGGVTGRSTDVEALHVVLAEGVACAVRLDRRLRVVAAGTSHRVTCEVGADDRSCCAADPRHVRRLCGGPGEETVKSETSAKRPPAGRRRRAPRGGSSSLALAKRTEKRCVVYTYFEDLGGNAAAADVEVWRQSWAEAGWTPVVLREADAAKHARYEEYKARFIAMPTTNDVNYEAACYLRHVAMVVVGGGTLTDVDVVNVNLPPSPNCDFLPNGGNLTTHDRFVPSIITGSAAAFDAMVQMILSTDQDEAFQVSGYTGKMRVSDMVFTRYFASKDPPTIAANCLFTEVPVDMPDPPCDEDGEELPMVFHVSHEAMIARYGGGNRTETMRREWARLKEAAMSRCTPLVFNTHTYGAKLWPFVKYTFGQCPPRFGPFARPKTSARRA